MENKTENLQEYISKRIRSLRLEKGMTQEQLEEKADLGQNYVYKLENLSNNVTIKTLEKIMTALDTKLETFFDIHLNEDDPIVSNFVHDLKQLPAEQRQRMITIFMSILQELK